MKISKNQRLLLGPPGTGKTTSLLNMIDDDLGRGLRPEEIGFVSFTKKAVSEAMGRACTKFSIKPANLPNFKTIHALCFNKLGLCKADVVGDEHLKEFGELIGHQFSGALTEQEGYPQGASDGDQMLFLDNFARISGRPLRAVWENTPSGIQWDTLERFQDGYQEYKTKKSVMDFTDMLFAYISMCEPLQLSSVYIDEGQDLSWAQWQVLKFAFSQSDMVTIAGDDDQSIYKWSGADTKTFLSLEGDKTILSKSYRLPKSVHAFANAIVQKIEHRFDKPFSPTEEEGAVSFVTQFEHLEINPEETTLILVRNKYLLSRPLEWLHHQGIPYVGSSGYSSVRTGHIAAIRALEQLRRGKAVPVKALKVMYENMKVGRYLERGGKAKMQLADDTVSFTLTELQAQFHLKELGDWYDTLEGIAAATKDYYYNILTNGYKLTERPKIQLSTIHGIKGGEADHVIIMSDMAARSFDEYMKDPDSERRVAYVAVTRSKKRLTIMQPFSRLSFNYPAEAA
jgi:superfamily I DNA/RNA helicase